jgi:tetratricopeptide (TPR) repeat protein
LCHLGELNLRTGSYQQARDDLWQALAICRETGDLPGQAEVLDLLGAVFLATGQLADARAQHAGALVLAIQLGDPYQQARAHRGLGYVEEASGDDVQASRHWHEALVRFAELETPEADQIRARLPGPVQLTLTVAVGPRLSCARCTVRPPT